MGCDQVMRAEPLSVVLVSSYEQTGELGLALCSLPCEDTARILKQVPLLTTSKIFPAQKLCLGVGVGENWVPILMVVRAPNGIVGNIWAGI